MKLATGVSGREAEALLKARRLEDLRTGSGAEGGAKSKEAEESKPSAVDF
jgi:hypothetical protein